MVKEKKAASGRKEFATKEDLKKFKEEIIHEFHIISEGLIDQIKLLAEGHSGIIQRLNRMEEGRDKRISELESQMKEVQEWKKQVQARFQA